MKKPLIFVEIESISAELIQNLRDTYQNKPHELYILRADNTALEDVKPIRVEMDKVGLKFIKDIDRAQVIETIRSRGVVHKGCYIHHIGEQALDAQSMPDDVAVLPVLSTNVATATATASACDLQLFKQVHRFLFEQVHQVRDTNTSTLLMHMDEIPLDTLSASDRESFIALIMVYEQYYASRSQQVYRGELARTLATYLQKAPPSLFALEKSLLNVFSLDYSLLKPTDLPAYLHKLAPTLREIAELTSETNYVENLLLLTALMLVIKEPKNEEYQEQLLNACERCRKDEAMFGVVKGLSSRICSQVFEIEAEQSENLRPLQLDTLKNTLAQIYQLDDNTTTSLFLSKLYDTLDGIPNDDERSVKELKVMAVLYKYLAEPNRRVAQRYQETFIEMLNALFADEAPQWRLVATQIADAEYLLLLNDKPNLTQEEIQRGTELSIKTLEQHKKNHPQWASMIDVVLAGAQNISAPGERAELFDTLEKTALYLNDPTNPERHRAFHQVRERARGKASHAWQVLGWSLTVLGVAVAITTSFALIAPAALMASATAGLVVALKAAVLSTVAGSGLVYQTREHGLCKELHSLEDSVREVSSSSVNTY